MGAPEEKKTEPNVFRDGQLIGSRLRKVRIKRELSQKKLSELSGVSQSTIAQVEMGNKSASIETLYRLSSALKIEIAVLFAEPNTFVINLERLRIEVSDANKLPDREYKAIGRIIKFAKDIGYS